jgi:hypothetical protein
MQKHAFGKTCFINASQKSKCADFTSTNNISVQRYRSRIPDSCLSIMGSAVNRREHRLYRS